jgi:ribose transport system permease protein
MTSIATEATAPPRTEATDDPRHRRDRLGIERFGGLYVIVLMCVVFGAWLETFRTLDNARIVAAGAAITGILTVGLIVSLISGVFDLSVGANMSLAITLVGWLQATAHVNPALTVLLTLLAGCAIGAANALIVTKLNVDAVIGTLGMSSILAALTYWIAGGKTILEGISPAFVRFGRVKPLTVPIPVYYLAGVALLIWYLLEHTPAGRYLYAIGSNANATRLAGVNVVRLQWAALMVSGTLASFAGIVLTMQLGAASYGAGTPYLLPAFAAAFLGSTQIRPGRFNVVGTLVALYLLAIGVKGLQLRWPSLPWIKSLFEGMILIIAVALGRWSARRNAART